MTNNRTLSGLMQTTTPELKQLKDTTNLLDNKQTSVLPNQTPTNLPTTQLLNAAQLAAQNNVLTNLQQATNLTPTTNSLQTTNQPKQPIQSTQQQQTTQINKESTNGQNQMNKSTKLDTATTTPSVLMNNNNVSNLINNNNVTNLIMNLNATNTIPKSPSKKEEIEDINIEDDEPTIEDEEIDAVDDIGGDSGEDDNITLKMKLKQQQQRILQCRSAFNEPKRLNNTNNLAAKFNNIFTSNNLISQLSQMNTKQAMAAVVSLTNNHHYGLDSPPSSSLKSPNSTSTTLPSSDDSPNSSFNSNSIAGSHKKRRKYMSYSIAELLQDKSDIYNSDHHQ